MTKSENLCAVFLDLLERLAMHVALAVINTDFQVFNHNNTDTVCSVHNLLFNFVGKRGADDVLVDWKNS